MDCPSLDDCVLANGALDTNGYGVSVEAVIANLAEEQGRILILMQEGDGQSGFANVDWSDSMFDAYELIKKAIRSLNEASLYE